MNRKPRAYKISDEDYFEAMKRAQKDGYQLATLVETFVIKYAQYGITKSVEDYERKKVVTKIANQAKKIFDKPLRAFKVTGDKDGQPNKEKAATKPVKPKETNLTYTEQRRLSKLK